MLMEEAGRGWPGWGQGQVAWVGAGGEGGCCSAGPQPSSAAAHRQPRTAVREGCMDLFWPVLTWPVVTTGSLRLPGPSAITSLLGAGTRRGDLRTLCSCACGARPPLCLSWRVLTPCARPLASQPELQGWQVPQDWRQARLADRRQAPVPSRRARGPAMRPRPLSSVP